MKLPSHSISPKSPSRSKLVIPARKKKTGIDVDMILKLLVMVSTPDTYQGFAKATAVPNWESTLAHSWQSTGRGTSFAAEGERFAWMALCRAQPPRLLPDTWWCTPPGQPPVGPALRGKWFPEWIAESFMNWWFTWKSFHGIPIRLTRVLSGTALIPISSSNVFCTTSNTVIPVSRSNSNIATG